MLKSRALLAATLLVPAGRGLAAVPADPRLAPPEVRRAWAELLRIEDWRQPAKLAVPRLKDVDARIRALAVRTLGRLADPAGRTWLEPILKADPDGRIRAEAAVALGLIKSKESVPALVEALGDVAAAGPAARALGLIGDPAAAESLAKLATARAVEAATRAAAWLGLAAFPESGAFARALPPSLPEEPELVEAFLLVVRKLGSEKAAEIPKGWAQTREPRLRAALLRATARRGGPGAFLKVLGLVPRESERAEAPRGLSIAAADAYGSFLDKPEAGEAADRLAPYLAHADDHVGLAAAGAALAAGPGPARAKEVERKLAPVLDALLERPGLPGARLAALVPVLARFHPARFALGATRFAAHPDPAVRAALVREAAGRDPEEAPALARLAARGLDDPDRRVQQAAVEGLATRKDAGATKALTARLEHADPPQVAAAAKALAERKAEGLGERLVAALRRLPAAHFEERQELVAALLALGEAARLAPFKLDPDPLLRGRVLAALGERAVPAKPPAAAEVGFYEKNLTRYPGRPRLAFETAKGSFTVELDLARAPLNGWNLMALATTGFYDGLGFHRVVPGFVAQGGDPRGDGYGGPGYTVRCELSFEPYRRGSVGMALAGRDTGGSQFFVTYDSTPHLEAGYTVLGRVVEGLEVVDRLLPGDPILKATRADAP